MKSDKDIHSAVKLAAKGDDTAWELLFTDSCGALYNFIYHRLGCNRTESDDVFQETYFLAVKKLNLFNSLRGTFQNWLYAIALNIIRQKGRRLKRYQEILIDYTDESVPDNDDDVDVAEKEIVNIALTLLSPSHQKVLTLKYVENLSLKEIAEILSISSEAVGSLLYRSRAAFKAAYSQLIKKKGELYEI